MTEEVKKYIDNVALPMKRIFVDMLKYAPSKLFGLLGNAVIVPIYTNLLTPSQYGVYVISLAVLSFLCILFSDWIGLSALRFFRQNELCGEIPKYFSTLSAVLVSNLTVMGVLAFIFRHKFYHYFNIPPKMFLLILVLVIPVAIRALFFQVLRAQIKPGAFTVSTILNQILTILISVLILKLTNLGAVSILIGMAISIALIDVILIFQSGIFKTFKFEIPNPAMMKTIFLYGLPISAASLSVWAITQSNKFIMKQSHGFDEVGLIGVAYNMTFPILMTLFAIITIAAFPRIINIYEDKIDVRPMISRLTWYFMLIALPLVIIMSLYSQDLVNIFANEKYAQAAVLIPYLSFSAFFLSFTDYTTMQYHLANKTYILTTLKVISGIIGLALNFYLIKTMGLIGAGIATLISNILYFALTVVVVIPKLEWQVPFKKTLHIFLCFIPAGLIWLVFQKSTVMPVMQMIILLIIYYWTFYLTRKSLKENVL